MIRTPQPGRRSVAVIASLSSAAALAVAAGGVPIATAGSYDATVCQNSDTRFFLNNVNGAIDITARYWNGSMTEPVVDTNPTTVRWAFSKSNKHVIVTAANGLVPLGGVKHVAGRDGGLVQDTSIGWDGSIKLRVPAAGNGYTLCGDDPARVSQPWVY